MCVLLLAAFNVLVRPTDPGLSSLTPHPTLLVALGIGARYGFAATLQAVFLLAAGHVAAVLWLLPQEAPGRYVVLESPYATPLLVLGLISLPFAMLVQRHINTARQYEKDRARLKEERAVHEDKLKELTEINIELARRIVRADVTLPTLCEHARRLTSKDRERLYHAALDLLLDVLPVKAATVWVLSAAGKPVRGPYRGAGSAPFPTAAVEPWPEVGDVLLLANAGVPLPPEAPFLLGRLREGTDGPVIAYLTVDEVPFLSSAQTFRLASPVVAWVSQALGLST